MAGKRRNVFSENKKQETTEIGMAAVRNRCYGLLSRLLRVRSGNCGHSSSRRLSCAGDVSESTGLVLGLFNEEADTHGQEKTFTKAATEFNKMVGGRLEEVLKLSGPVPKQGEVTLRHLLVNLT
ncbi:hypothetical protein AAG570_012298 [Ranatra chinensis]|uniref:Uncharacterized protein n=1 Tax=Ranatra chinensis TaxID=642074 RepID=A0ABD0YIP3_9HEMI